MFLDSSPGDSLFIEEHESHGTGLSIKPSHSGTRASPESRPNNPVMSRNRRCKLLADILCRSGAVIHESTTTSSFRNFARSLVEFGMASNSKSMIRSEDFPSAFRDSIFPVF